MTGSDQGERVERAGNSDEIPIMDSENTDGSVPEQTDTSRE